MLNGVLGWERSHIRDRQSPYGYVCRGEPAGYERDFHALCKQLRTQPRPFLVVGGDAALWNVDPAYNILVEKYLKIARYYRILAIPGGAHL